jgi:hypothetical protein
MWTSVAASRSSSEKEVTTIYDMMAGDPPPVNQISRRMDPISQISKCIILFSARALTAGQLGAIFLTGDAWTFSDGLCESATTLPSPSHFLHPIPPPSSSTLPLMILIFLVCNPPVL